MSINLHALARDRDFPTNTSLLLGLFSEDRVRGRLSCASCQNLKQNIPKDTNVRCSDWENFPLSSTQENYAAIDAYAGYAIYMKLTELK